MLYDTILFYAMLYYTVRLCLSGDRGQREQKGSFRGYPKQGGAAVFSWLLSLESGQPPPLNAPP